MIGGAIFAATLNIGILALFNLLTGLFWIAYAALVVVMIVKSYKGEWFRLPVIGSLAENMTK